MLFKQTKSLKNPKILSFLLLSSFLLPIPFFNINKANSDKRKLYFGPYKNRKVKKYLGPGKLN